MVLPRALLVSLLVLPTIAAYHQCGWIAPVSPRTVTLIRKPITGNSRSKHFAQPLLLHQKQTRLHSSNNDESQGESSPPAPTTTPIHVCHCATPLLASTGNSQTKKKNNYARIGNFLNAASVVMVVLFLSDSARDMFRTPMSYNIPTPDNDWIWRGFCIKNYGSMWTSTHAICFYFNALVTLFYAVERRFKTSSLVKGPATEDAVDDLFGVSPNNPKNKAPRDSKVGSVFAHGSGHMFLSFLTRQGATPLGNLPTWTGFLAMFPLFLTSLPTMKFHLRPLVALIAAAIPCIPIAVPAEVKLGFCFTWVGSVLIASYALRELLAKSCHEKGFVYLVQAIFSAFLVSLFGWFEVLTCKRWWSPIMYVGHAWYDAACSLCFLMVYLACRLKDARSNSAAIVSSEPN